MQVVVVVGVGVVVFFNFPFFMDFQIVHTLILQVGFWFLTLHVHIWLTLSKQMLDF